ncbi:uncharacterized protein LOC130712211 [Lotus japonicus]|uniref:uncharacterized protein LOC130712211 n=1 Tax=Lotus japonicus TaxID=34305 RepID=UPI00258E872A|nr:uncharacterized protein LOC130712211 [Lotus japonicus]
MERGPNFVLTSDESESLLIPDLGEDEGSSRTADFWLVGKVVAQNSFNVRAFKTTIAQVWKVKQGVEIREVGRNLFTFRFFDERDRSWVLKQGPWNFDRFLVAVQILDPQENPTEVVLDRIPFWVRVHELPLALRTESVARSIGDSLGGFISWDRNEDNRLGPFLRLRSWVKITCPLRRGTIIARQGRNPLKVWFQYERLSNFCYMCGGLDHVLKDCAGFDGDEEEEGIQALPYGAWIRAPPLRSNVISGIRGEVSRSGVNCPEALVEGHGPVVTSDTVPSKGDGRVDSEVLVDALVSNLAKVNMKQVVGNCSETEKDQVAVEEANQQLKASGGVKPSTVILNTVGQGSGLEKADEGAPKEVTSTEEQEQVAKAAEAQHTEELCVLVGPEETVVMGGPVKKIVAGKGDGRKWKKIARDTKALSSAISSAGASKRKSSLLNDPMVLMDSIDDVPLKKLCDMLTVEAGDQPRRQP